MNLNCLKKKKLTSEKSQDGEGDSHPVWEEETSHGLWGRDGVEELLEDRERQVPG